ncbi:MAG: DUF7146 domain-containing protein [Reyranella sp.]
MTSRFAVAKERVVDALDDIVPELFGTGRRNAVRGRSGWYVPSPGSGSTPDQMVIWRTGDRRGGWKDYSTGAQGDAIDLFAYVRFGAVTQETRMRAVEAIEDRFGIRSMTPEARAEIETAGRRRREVAAAREAEAQLSARERSRKAFFAAAPAILGTPVEIYLRARGVELGQVPNLTGAFRYRADAEWWMGAQHDREGRKTAPGPKYPAMVSAMSDAGGAICALHYTFIAPNGRGKAPVLVDGKSKAKLMYPEVSGLVVRVTHGPSGLKCEDAGERGIFGIIGVTEGIEDALSAAIAYPQLRMFAAGSLSGFLTLPDQRCASAFLIFRDNDWGKPQAAKLFKRAIARLKGFGKPVEVVSMPADWGKDVNDTLNT